MHKPKINTGFSAYRDLALAQKARHILNKMTGNGYYPAPIPGLPDVTGALETYEADLLAVMGGDKSQTAAKKQSREVLVDVLNKLALYVQQNCQDNLEILLSSGYDSRKERSPVGLLAKGEDFKVEPGPVPGSVKASIKPVKGADNYIVEYTEAPVTPQSVWKSQLGSKSEIVIMGLVSGQQYAFRMAGVGTNPVLVFSDIITAYVL